MNAEINKEFIFRYLSGNSSALQKQLVDEWVKVPAQEELFYSWLVEFEYQNPQYLTDLPLALARFQVEIEESNQNFTQPLSSGDVHPTPKNPFRAWMVAAAVLVGVLFCGAFFKDSILTIKYESVREKSRSLRLEDGTNVILSANSSLEVPRFGFGSSTRQVFLTGEASFSVTHLANHQKFVVKTDKNLEVVVLGTEFTVYARQQKARVALNKGKVLLNYQAGPVRKQLTMKPGERVTLDHDNLLTKEIRKQPATYDTQPQNQFEFKDTSLSEFVELMNAKYGIKLSIRDRSLARRTLVGSYSAESPEELLDMVSRVFNLQIKKEGDTLVLATKMKIP